MRNRASLVVAVYLFMLFLLLFVHFDAQAEEPCQQWVAKVVSVEGDVEIHRGGTAESVPVKLNDTVCPNDVIQVKRYSRAAISFRNETMLRVDQSTTLAFSGKEEDQSFLLKILNGSTHFFTRSPKGLKVTTPFVNAAVGGTEFSIRVERDRTFISMVEGRLSATNDAGSLNLKGGQAAVARRGEAPMLQIAVRPLDAVQWALYYPPVLDYRPSDFQGGGGWQEMVGRSLEFYWKRELTKAFESIEGIPEPVPDPRFYSYRAALLLTVGRVDEASSDIERALAIDPANAHAYALQSVVAVAQNRKKEALDLAIRATELAPDSSSSFVALSYAQQAHFDLDAALSSLKRAVGLDPKNELAWARLAEIHLSVKQLGKALEAARRAVDLNPSLSRTQTVLGFAYLTEIKTRESRLAFEKAIELDQSDPLPHLGLGLATIRDGHLKEGRKEIEIAVILDPSNSLIRSYLGKAYFEEKRDKQAADSFAIAKELDPMDPTPWLYDSIRKQTVNRPVEALEDIQKSIALNDNRVVYRSRLMLDEDLAARSVSLARIYDDLGFQWVALSEAWKSVNLDPTNFSAHRFLADSYFSLPRHDIARVSELLQAQLLQPLNLMPIQPQLAESRSVFLNFVGPRDPSYNEYTPLFVRDQLTFLTDGVAGERDTIAEDMVLSGLYGKFSGSMGQSHAETDGIRHNNELVHDIYDAFAQVSITPSTSIQAEYRYRDWKTGDPDILFNPDLFDPRKRQHETSETYRFGMRQSFSPRSDLIVSFAYRVGDFDYDTSYYASETDNEAYSLEVQHLYRSERFNVIVGGGHNNADQETRYGDNPLLYDTDTTHRNMYVYSRWNFPQSVIWTVGISTDFFETDVYDQSEEQVNPKFGVAWNPLPGTTLRGAAFRTLQRQILNKQTIEPTQVAGFNQFYDDVNGTDAWLYGVGLDQKLADSLFAGMEYLWRDWSAPFVPPWNEAEIHEEFGRAYTSWAPHPWFSTSLEYEYFHVEYPSYLPLWALSNLHTHRISLGFGFYHPSGLIGRLKPSFVLQDGDTGYGPGEPTDPLSSDFFVLDASIGYRLPRRLGLIELEARNLFDKSFRYQDIDPTNPRLTPGRFMVLKWALSF